MGVFRDKSDKTFCSAEFLLDNSHFNSCVHCFYYSCFQLIIDLLKEEYRYTDEQISSGTNNSTSHNNIINQLKSCLKNSQTNCNIFSDFGQIKKARIKADYQEQSVAEKEAKKIKEKAIEIRKALYKIYENGI